MHPSCEDFLSQALQAHDVAGKELLEVGAQDVNGSVRRRLESYGPSSYVGVDIIEGPGVDEVCSVDQLLDRFGENAFDAVLTTETLEHVVDWRTAIHNLKGVLRPGGLLVITTRSPGFAIHAYPIDCWRYTVNDMQLIFSDFTIDQVTKDVPADPGVFLRARKPEKWAENELSSLNLYSIARRSRTGEFTTVDKWIVQSITTAQRRLPREVTFCLRFFGNLLGMASPDRRAAGADLTSNMHQPY